MSKLSRTKGASFERELVKIFREELGVECRRNLTQYQESELGDIELGELILVEAKRYKAGNWFAPSWWEQTKHAAAKQNMIPCLIWRYDRQPIRVTLPVYAINADWAMSSDQYSWPTAGNGLIPVTLDLAGGLSVIREWLV